MFSIVCVGVSLKKYKKRDGDCPTAPEWGDSVDKKGNNKPWLAIKATKSRVISKIPFLLFVYPQKYNDAVGEETETQTTNNASLERNNSEFTGEKPYRILAIPRTSKC